MVLKMRAVILAVTMSLLLLAGVETAVAQQPEIVVTDAASTLLEGVSRPGVTVAPSTATRIVVTGATAVDRTVIAPRPVGPTDTVEPALRIIITAAQSESRALIAPRPDRVAQLVGTEPAKRITITSAQAAARVVLAPRPGGPTDTLEPHVRIRVTAAAAVQRVVLVDPSIPDVIFPALPGKVSNLHTEAGEALGSFVLEWTAPGTERAASYDIRYSANPMTEANWASATPVPVAPPAPATPGTPESLTISELPTGPLDARYHFALKSSNGLGGTSPLSNVPATLTCRRAVVLVHGWQSSPAGAWGDGDLDFAAALEGDGFCVHSSLDLDPSNGDIKELAAQLKLVVDGLVGDGYSSVDLVTHSMGGLVSRYYTTFIDPGNVTNIIMLGTPNHGSTLFTYARPLCLVFAKGGFQAVALCLAAVEPIKGEAGRQMEASSLFLRDLNGPGLPDGIAHWTIAGTNALSGPWGGVLAVASLFVVPNPDDGVVSARSVCLEGTNDQHYQFPVNHFGLHESEDVKGLISAVLKGSSLVGISCTPAVSASAVAGVVNTTLTPQVAADIFGVVAPAEEQRHTVPLESGIASARFFTLVSDPATTFSLQTPSGVIDPSSPAYSEVGDGLVKVYELTEPEPGDWALVLSLPESAPAPASYEAWVLLAAEVGLDLAVPASYLVPGETV